MASRINFHVLFSYSLETVWPLHSRAVLECDGSPFRSGPHSVWCFTCTREYVNPDICLDVLLEDLSLWRKLNNCARNLQVSNVAYLLSKACLRTKISIVWLISIDNISYRMKPFCIEIFLLTYLIDKSWRAV